ncbi:hypothetical protein ACVWXM_008244 [Bradyrhizobium sp. GM7.3]|jgi:uncharacterized oxidoreductase
MARKAGAARQASSDLVVGAAAFPEALLDTHDAGVAEVMQLLELRVHPGGEVLVERDRARRWAERDGCYEATFAAMNPS